LPKFTQRTFFAIVLAPYTFILAFSSTWSFLFFFLPFSSIFYSFSLSPFLILDPPTPPPSGTSQCFVSPWGGGGCYFLIHIYLCRQLDFIKNGTVGLNIATQDGISFSQIEGLQIEMKFLPWNGNAGSEI
jgi:hypothetical protein